MAARAAYQCVLSVMLLTKLQDELKALRWILIICTRVRKSSASASASWYTSTTANIKG